MALASTTVWSGNASATTASVNGAGFNPGNANFIANWAATSATGNAPVITSASYSFVAGDVGAYFYVKSGTNWTPGMYPIASVNAGAATLDATIGSASQLDSVSGMWKPNTVAGCATTGSPTSGTCGVNYAPLTAAFISLTDIACTGSASTNMTSVAALFTAQIVGNVIRVNNQGTGNFAALGWYEIISYTNTTTVVTDRTIANSATAVVAAQGKIGGAISFSGGLEDVFLEGDTTTTDGFQGSNFLFLKGGNYTMSSAVSVVSTRSTAVIPGYIVGFKTIWGDNPAPADQPVIIQAANAFNPGQYHRMYYLKFTGTATDMQTTPIGVTYQNCRAVNASATAARTCFTMNAESNVISNCDVVSLNGTAVYAFGGSCKVLNSYIHDSNIGIRVAVSGSVIESTIVEACKTAGIQIDVAGGRTSLINNTIYGRESKLGIGISLNNAAAINNLIVGNIIYGWTSGAVASTAQEKSNLWDFNNWFNNTTDVTLITKGPSDTAVNPAFVAASQLSGTAGTATAGAAVITDGAADFSSVVDDTSYVRIDSHSGGAGTIDQCYQITAHSGTTLTVTPVIGSGGGSVTSIVYTVTRSAGRNFAIGTALKGLGAPTSFNGSGTSQYADTGAAQRQEAGGGMLVGAGMTGGMRG